MKRVRAGAIVVRNNHILLIYRKKGENEYFVTPGGGVEDQESIQEAVVRELYEETSMCAEVDRELFFHESYDIQHYFLMKNVSGTPKLHKDSVEAAHFSEMNIFKPVWIPLAHIPTLKLFPKVVKKWLIGYVFELQRSHLS